MIIELTYGESKEVVLDTAFSLSFLQKLIERGLISKEFMKMIAIGGGIPESFDDYYNLPYCCYLNNNLDPMTKAEFEERFILNIPMMKAIYTYVMLGDANGSKMKNIFKAKPQKKTESSPTSGE